MLADALRRRQLAAIRFGGKPELLLGLREKFTRALAWRERPDEEIAHGEGERAWFLRRWRSTNRTSWRRRVSPLRGAVCDQHRAPSRGVGALDGLHDQARPRAAESAPVDLQGELTSQPTWPYTSCSTQQTVGSFESPTAAASDTAIANPWRAVS